MSEDEFLRLDLGKFGEWDRFQGLNFADDALFPVLVDGRPVLVVVTSSALEEFDAFLNLLGSVTGMPLI
jgi:hypothetical protein